MTAMAAEAASFARKRNASSRAILEAASELIAEAGISGLTISEVARRAQINRALVYHYFGDRETLVRQAIDYIIARNKSVVSEPNLDAAGSNLRMLIEHPEIARFFFHLLLDGRPLLELGRHVTDAIAEVRQRQDEGTTGEYDAAFAVIMLALTQSSWAFSRGEFARLLGISVEEADERFTQFVRDLAERGLPAAEARDSG